MPTKYNEWRLSPEGTKISIIRTVSIDDSEADMMNGDSKRTMLLYEKEPPKKAVETTTKDEPDAQISGDKELRKELIRKLKAAGVKVNTFASTDDLLNQVNELKL